MSRAGTLLHVVRALLERSYRMETGLVDLAPFLVGDSGYRHFYDARTRARIARALERDARILVRETPEGVRLALYFPDALIENLEAYPPQRGIGRENVEAFATFVEEIDHLLVIAERARTGQTVTLFELELHANVSKYLVLGRYLAGSRGHLAEPLRLWLRHELFERGVFSDEDPEVRERYREASRFAVQFLDGWRELPTTSRVEMLRRFHAADVGEKIALTRALAA